MTLKGDLAVLLVLLAVTVVLIVLVIARRRLLQRPGGTRRHVRPAAAAQPGRRAGRPDSPATTATACTGSGRSACRRGPGSRSRGEAMTLSHARRPVGPESIALAPDTVIVTVRRSERPAGAGDVGRHLDRIPGLARVGAAGQRACRTWSDPARRRRAGSAVAQVRPGRACARRAARLSAAASVAASAGRCGARSGCRRAATARRRSAWFATRARMNSRSDSRLR